MQLFAFGDVAKDNVVMIFVHKLHGFSGCA
jgi:hypothetical protein